MRFSWTFLVVVQVLRLCAPFRQCGVASFADFFSPLTSSRCDGVSVLSLLASLPPALPCGSLLLRESPSCTSHATTQLASLRDHWFAGKCSGSPSLYFTTTWSAVCEDWFLFLTLRCFVSRFTDCVHPHQVRVFIAASDSGQQLHIRDRRLLSLSGRWDTLPLQFASGLQHHCVVCATA